MLIPLDVLGLWWTNNPKRSSYVFFELGGLIMPYTELLKGSAQNNKPTPSVNSHGPRLCGHAWEPGGLMATLRVDHATPLIKPAATEH